MELADLRRTLDWAAQEGWNPGLDDAPAFLGADAEGFFLAELDGTPAAAISVVNHSDAFSFLGLYICRPDLRGRGIGKALWEHAIAHAGGRTIGLDAVPEQEENYRRSGFTRADGNTRFIGRVAPGNVKGIRPCRVEDIPVLTRLDAQATGYGKKAFFGRWLTDTGHRRSIVLERSGRLAGFATVRACREWFKIGPLVAENLADACSLLEGAAFVTGGEPFMIDLPARGVGLGAVLKSWNFETAFATRRMYRGPAPHPGAAVCAIATLELG